VVVVVVDLVDVLPPPRAIAGPMPLAASAVVAADVTLSVVAAIARRRKVRIRAIPAPIDPSARSHHQVPANCGRTAGGGLDVCSVR
jgi:hypothetical protein